MVPRQPVGQWMRIAQPVQLPLDLAGPRQHAGFRVAQRFPRPIQHARVVAGDLQLKLAVLLASRRIEQAARGPVAEQGPKRLLAPGFQRIPQPLGMIRLSGGTDNPETLPDTSAARASGRCSAAPRPGIQPGTAPPRARPSCRPANAPLETGQDRSGPHGGQSVFSSSLPNAAGEPFPEKP